MILLLAAVACGDGICPDPVPPNGTQTVAPPAITVTSDVTAVAGLDLTYQILTSNRPTLYGAVGLPQGLNVNASTGIITGAPITAGQYQVMLSASNASGKGTAALTLTVNSGTGSACNAGVVTPPAAQSAGYDNLAFCDDFNSQSTIDVNGTGAAGYNWYPNMPFDWPGRTPASDYSVSNSILTLTGTGAGPNWGIASMDPTTGKGHMWMFAYIEARISFDPTLWSKSTGWPSVWTASAVHVLTNYPVIYPELDVFEFGHPANFYGTLHQWQNGLAIDYANANSMQQAQVDWNNWHTVAVLWVPGQVTWYLDGTALMSQTYSASAPPSPLASTAGGVTPTPAGVFNILDTQAPGVVLILGTGPNWPIKVDWVRVWQK
jgi:hypothetical protein